MKPFAVTAADLLATIRLERKLRDGRTLTATERDARAKVRARLEGHTGTAVLDMLLESEIAELHIN